MIWIPDPPYHDKLYSQTVSPIKTSFLPWVAIVGPFVTAMRKTIPKLNNT